MNDANKDIQKPPGEAGASHNSGECDPSVMPDSSSGGAVQCNAKELRARARLAWNNWPDTEASRREISAHEARDPISAASWGRVIDAILAVRLDEAAIRADEREKQREIDAKIAEHLNGWGVPRQPELAHHIALVIRGGKQP